MSLVQLHSFILIGFVHLLRGLRLSGVCVCVCVLFCFNQFLIALSFGEELRMRSIPGKKQNSVRILGGKVFSVLLLLLLLLCLLICFFKSFQFLFQHSSILRAQEQILLCYSLCLPLPGENFLYLTGSCHQHFLPLLASVIPNDLRCSYQLQQVQRTFASPYLTSLAKSLFDALSDASSSLRYFIYFFFFFFLLRNRI